MEYQVIKNLATGISHVQRGAPCEDAVAYRQEDKIIIMADADGHSDPRCFRAHIGSKLACEAAKEQLYEYFKEDMQRKMKKALLEHEKEISRKICEDILDAWHKKVEAHYYAHPFTKEEGFKEAEENKEAVYRAYGTNLICAVITPKYWWAAQNGDGVCICILGMKHLAEIGKAAYVECIPSDEVRNMANYSSSLCDEDAIDTFRYTWGEMEEYPLEGLCLTSDGIGSHTTEEVRKDMFYKLGDCTVKGQRKLVKRITEEINQKWTPGDDISFVAAYRLHDEENEVMGIPQPLSSPEIIEERIKKLQLCLEEERKNKEISEQFKDVFKKYKGEDKCI